MKTDTGFQLFRVGSASSGPVTQTIGTNSTNPTQIRLQTVPAAVSRITGPPTIALRKTFVGSSTTTTASSTSSTATHHQQQQQTNQQQQIRLSQSAALKQKQILNKQNVICLFFRHIAN